MSGALFSLNKLSNIISVLKHVASDSTSEAANVAETYAQDHVQVLTGKTKASIHTEVNGHTVSLIADGAALYLEYGTVHMRAYPFMRPAIDEAERVIGPAHLKSNFESGAGL